MGPPCALDILQIVSHKAGRQEGCLQEPSRNLCDGTEGGARLSKGDESQRAVELRLGQAAVVARHQVPYLQHVAPQHCLLTGAWLECDPVQKAAWMRCQLPGHVHLEERVLGEIGALEELHRL